MHNLCMNSASLDCESSESVSRTSTTLIWVQQGSILRLAFYLAFILQVIYFMLCLNVNWLSILIMSPMRFGVNLHFAVA